MYPQRDYLIWLNKRMPRPRTATRIIAENVQRLRDVYAFTFDDISRKAHIGSGTVSRICNAQAAPTADVLAAVAAVFDLPAWALLVPDLDPHDPPAQVLSREGVRQHARDRESAAVLERMLQAVSAPSGPGESSRGVLPSPGPGRSSSEKSRT